MHKRYTRDTLRHCLSKNSDKNSYSVNLWTRIYSQYTPNWGLEINSPNNQNNQKRPTTDLFVDFYEPSL